MTSGEASPRARVVVEVVGLLGAATGVGFLLEDHVGEAARVMVYLVAVMGIAYRGSGGVAVLAALLAVAAFDFFFTAPRFTLAVYDPGYLLTFGVMAGAGIAIASLTARLRRKTRESMAHALAVETERMRTAMLSSVSHDLRTPLGTLMGASTALSDGSVDPASPHAHALIETIRDESARLEHQLGNLLQMTRIQGGGLRLDREWHVPEEVIGQALDRLRTRLTGREVALDIGAEPALVHVDALAVELVVANLLENAAKYAPVEAPIEVRSRAEAATWVIEVLDRGPGLPPGDRGRLFDRFVRGEGVEAQGVGLGLAICKAMVRMHDGQIEAADRPGGGAVFVVRLPAGEIPAGIDEADGATPDGVSSAR